MNLKRVQLRSIACFPVLLIFGNVLVDAVCPTDIHAEDRVFAYVGTLSSPINDGEKSPPNHGRGIHIFEVNQSTGELTPFGVVELPNSPTCLVIDNEHGRLFSANETDHIAPNGEGSVTSYSLDPTSGIPKPISTVRSGGAGPTYISIHPSRKFLLVANYVGGTIAVLPISAGGRLAEPVEVTSVEGEVGPKHAQNAPPGSFAHSGHDRSHAHMIQADISGKFVLHTDLGLDRIFIWKFDNTSGQLSPGETPSVALPAGDGPRHLCFHPGRKSLYSIQEEASTITRFDYDAKAGKLLPQQTISTLPLNFAGSNFASTVLVSPSGKFLYAGNRLHDSIAILAIDEKDQLRFIRNVWAGGSYPSNFNFDPSGRLLYCCNQNSDNVSSFKLNDESGDLESTELYTPVGNPMSIVVWKKKAN